jgi:hypothetical protein
MGIKVMPLDLTKLMKLYARRGVSDWNEAPDNSKQIARFALANRIAQNEWEANRTIAANLKGGADERCMFIPMPRVNHSGIMHSFFLPINEAGKTAFDLLLIVDSEQSLGFRFEPSDPPDWAHGYGHVQFNRSMFRKTMAVSGIPQWLPNHYPAFPIRSAEPLPMFLSMATSIHGYETGMKQILPELFPNEPSTAKQYLSALEAAVN